MTRPAGKAPKQTGRPQGKGAASGSPPAPGAKTAPASKPTPPAKPSGDISLPPLKPRKGLFITLLIGFLIWVGALLVLYMTTVHPLRYPKTTAPVSGRS